MLAHHPRCNTKNCIKFNFERYGRQTAFASGNAPHVGKKQESTGSLPTAQARSILPCVTRWPSAGGHTSRGSSQRGNLRPGRQGTGVRERKGAQEAGEGGRGSTKANSCI